MKAVLYEADWQKIRIDCLAARRRDGGWTTAEGCEANLNTFAQYLEASTGAVNRDIRTYRMNNCINAVVMGLRGQGRTNLVSPLQLWRNENVPNNWDQHQIAAAAYQWNWRREVEKLRSWSCADLRFLLADLERRSRNGSQKTRGELHKYIGCIKLALP